MSSKVNCHPVAEVQLEMHMCDLASHETKFLAVFSLWCDAASPCTQHTYVKLLMLCWCSLKKEGLLFPTLLSLFPCSPFFFFGDNSHKQEQFFRNNISLFMHAVIPLYLKMKLSMSIRVPGSATLQLFSHGWSLKVLENMIILNTVFDSSTSITAGY